MSFKEIKTKAKSVYKGNVADCAKTELASFVIKCTPLLVIFTAQFLCMQKLNDGISGILSGIFGILYLAAIIFVCLPVGVGAGMYFTAKIGKKNPITDKIFCAYKNLSVKGAASAIPFGIVVIETVIGDILLFAAYKPLNGGLIAAVAVVLLEIAVIIYTLAAYAPLTYVLETYSDVTAGMAVGKTLRISSKNRGKIIRFYLSFILWAILGTITLGIGFIWIMPYIRLSARVLFSDLDKG